MSNNIIKTLPPDDNKEFKSLSLYYQKAKKNPIKLITVNLETSNPDVPSNFILSKIVVIFQS